MTLLNDLRPARIAVLRALQLGDLLCAVPAFRALRAALPEAEITLVGLPWAAGFVERFSAYLDRFVEFPGWPGLPERELAPEQVPPFLSAMQAERFDLVIQMHGSGRITNPLALLLGGRVTAGYVQPGEFCPNPETFLPFPHALHEVRTHLRLMEFLGAPPHGEELEFPLSAADRAELAALPKAAPLQPGAYLCLHPGSRWPSRRWPVERFAAAGDALAKEGFQIVLTGSEDERRLAREVQEAMHVPVLNLAGRTGLGALGALLEGARLLICNDTGVSHVTAGIGTPSVVIVTGSDPQRWAPLEAARHRAVWSPIDCRPCEHRVCPIGHPCADAVSVERVLQEARPLLGRATATAAKP